MWEPKGLKLRHCVLLILYTLQFKVQAVSILILFDLLMHNQLDEQP